MGAKEIIVRCFLLLAGAVIMESCSAALPNIGEVKEEVISYYHSGKYEAELNNVVDKAIAEFEPGCF
jgi:hypothetical protein